MKVLDSEPSPFSNPKKQCGAALLSAVLLWLPAQKWGLFPLAWAGLTPLLVFAWSLDAKSRRKFGWRAGFLFYVLTNWWILPTIVYGSPMIGAPPVLGAFLGVLAVGFIAFVHAWQFAVGLWLWDTKKWARHLWILPIVVALWWGFFDWLRCIPPLAHIWGALAFTQWRDIPLLQIAPFVGQHGITILLVWFSASLALFFQQRRFSLVAAPLFIFLTIHLWGAVQLKKPLSHSDSMEALLVSTNVPSLRKSRSGNGESNFQQALRLTNEVTPRWDHYGRGLIVWPETTFELWQVENNIRPASAEIPQWNRMFRILNGPPVIEGLLSGVTIHQLDGMDENLYNSAVLLDKKAIFQSAPKIRTVPMGERAPFGEYLPFLRRLAPDPQVTPGTAPKTLNLDGKKIGTVVCFESCFPEPARSLKKQGAQELFIITNDEYFRGTNAPWEHAAMAVLRAAENQIPVAQVANGGYTLSIDSRGRIMHQSFGASAQIVTIPFS